MVNWTAAKAAVAGGTGVNKLASQGVAEQLVAGARSQVGRTEWAKSASRGPYPEGTNKCNLFVYEMLQNQGMAPPKKKRWVFGKKYPPLAGDWGDKDAKIPGWEVVSTPKPGDVVAIKNLSSFAGDIIGATGHVGIVSGDRTTISADKNAIVENDWGFREGQAPVYRRYSKGQPQ